MKRLITLTIALWAVVGVFWLSQTTVLAQEPDVSSTDELEILPSPLTGTGSFTSVFTVPSNDYTYNRGYKIDTDNQYTGGSLGNIAVYDPDDNLINWFNWYGDVNSYSNAQALMVPGDYTINFIKNSSTTPVTEYITVTVYSLSYSPTPPTTCEPIISATGVETPQTITATTTRVYSSMILSAVTTGGASANIGKIGMTWDGSTEYTNDIYGTGDWALYTYTSTTGIDEDTELSVNTLGAGGNAPYYPLLTVYGCHPDVTDSDTLTCDTVTNAHFDDGLTGWDVTNVITAPSEAIFEAGGSVSQAGVSVMEEATNFVKNPAYANNVTDDWGLQQLGAGGATVTHTMDTFATGGAYASIYGGAGGYRYRNTTAIVVGDGESINISVRARNINGIQFLFEIRSLLTNTSPRSMLIVSDGWNTYSLNWTNDTGVSASVVVWLASYIGGGDVDVDWVQITKTAYQLPFFYGDMDTAVWDGTEHASTSTGYGIEESTVTAHWIGRSDTTHAVNATVSISSAIGIDSATHEFTAVKTEHSDELAINSVGDYSVIVEADEGFALDYLCLEFEDPTVIGGETVCYTVDDASFDDDSGAWTLTDADITSGSLEIDTGGSASQSVLLDANSQYTVVMSSTFNSASDLSITLGDYTDVLTIPIAASVSYEQVFTTGATITDSIISLASTAGDVDIHYICFEQVDRAYGVCLSLVQNGEFESDDYWLWRNGAMWNNIAANGFLPALDNATWEDYNLSAVGQKPLTGYVPEISDGEYLILQFDARSSEPGYITARIRDLGFSEPLTLTFTADTSNQYTRYEMPVSLLSGHDGELLELGFFNVGGTTDEYTSTAGIFVDNVCLYLSNEEPQLPVISPTYGGYAGGLAFTCGTVSEWLYELTGINFPALEEMEAPSIWNVDDWVPWLASRLWVNVGHPLACILISLFNNSSVLSVINWFDWAVRTAEQFPTWLAAWWNSALLSIFMWFAWFQTGQHTWMEFFGLLVSWLWDSLINLGAWLAGSINAQITGLINTIIAAWNMLMPGIRGAVSSVMDLMVELWNMVAPYIGYVVGFAALMFSLLALIGPAILAFIGPIWTIISTLVSLLYHNFSLTLNLPVNIYRAFDASVNGEAFVFVPTCSEGGDYWCNFIFGIQVVNNIAGQSIIYPIVIVLIIVLTATVIGKHVWETVRPPGVR